MQALTMGDGDTRSKRSTVDVEGTRDVLQSLFLDR
jgi:hypothetical protein